MKCQKYEITVYNSAFDFAHAHGHTVTEIYIPTYNLAFNYNNNKLNIFNTLVQRSNTSSYPIVYIDIPINLIEKIVEINNMEKQSILLKENIKIDIEKILKNI